MLQLVTLDRSLQTQFSHSLMTGNVHGAIDMSLFDLLSAPCTLMSRCGASSSSSSNSGDDNGGDPHSGQLRFCLKTCPTSNQSLLTMQSLILTREGCRDRQALRVCISLSAHGLLACRCVAYRYVDMSDWHCNHHMQLLCSFYGGLI